MSLIPMNKETITDETGSEVHHMDGKQKLACNARTVCLVSGAVVGSMLVIAMAFQATPRGIYSQGSMATVETADPRGKHQLDTIQLSTVGLNQFCKEKCNMVTTTGCVSKVGDPDELYICINGCTVSNLKMACQGPSLCSRQKDQKRCSSSKTYRGGTWKHCKWGPSEGDCVAKAP